MLLLLIEMESSCGGWRSIGLAYWGSSRFKVVFEYKLTLQVEFRIDTVRWGGSGLFMLTDEYELFSSLTILVELVDELEDDDDKDESPDEDSADKTDNLDDRRDGIWTISCFLFDSTEKLSFKNSAGGGGSGGDGILLNNGRGSGGGGMGALHFLDEILLFIIIMESILMKSANLSLKSSSSSQLSRFFWFDSLCVKFFLVFIGFSSLKQQLQVPSSFLGQLVFVAVLINSS